MSALLLTGCSEIATKYQISQCVSKDHELFSFCSFFFTSIQSGEEESTRSFTSKVLHVMMS